MYSIFVLNSSRWYLTRDGGGDGGCLPNSWDDARGVISRLQRGNLMRNLLDMCKHRGALVGGRSMKCYVIVGPQ